MSVGSGSAPTRWQGVLSQADQGYITDHSLVTICLPSSDSLFTLQTRPLPNVNVHSPNTMLHTPSQHSECLHQGASVHPFLLLPPPLPHIQVTLSHMLLTVPIPSSLEQFQRTQLFSRDLPTVSLPSSHSSFSTQSRHLLPGCPPQCPGSSTWALQSISNKASCTPPVLPFNVSPGRAEQSLLSPDPHA